MAKGYVCRSCKSYMRADNEELQPKGSWVTYECTNGLCTWEVRVFEKKS